MAKKSLPEEVRDAFTTGHPLVRGAKAVADTTDWATAKAKDAYRWLTTPATPTKRRGDIYLRPPTTRSARKR